MSIQNLNGVRYTPQTLTSEQQAQVRQNIGAAAEGQGGGAIIDTECCYKLYFIDSQTYAILASMNDTYVNQPRYVAENGKIATSKGTITAASDLSAGEYGIMGNDLYYAFRSTSGQRVVDVLMAAESDGQFRIGTIDNNYGNNGIVLPSYTDSYFGAGGTYTGEKSKNYNALNNTNIIPEEYLENLYTINRGVETFVVNKHYLTSYGLHSTASVKYYIVPPSVVLTSNFTFPNQSSINANLKIIFVPDYQYKYYNHSGNTNCLHLIKTYHTLTINELNKVDIIPLTKVSTHKLVPVDEYTASYLTLINNYTDTDIDVTYTVESSTTWGTLELGICPTADVPPFNFSQIRVLWPGMFDFSNNFKQTCRVSYSYKDYTTEQIQAMKRTVQMAHGKIKEWNATTGDALVFIDGEQQEVTQIDSGWDGETWGADGDSSYWNRDINFALTGPLKLNSQCIFYGAQVKNSSGELIGDFVVTADGIYDNVTHRTIEVDPAEWTITAL